MKECRNMNIVQSNNHEEKIQNLYQRLNEIQLLFSEGKMEEEIYLKEERKILDSLEELFIHKNLESVLFQ